MKSFRLFFILLFTSSLSIGQSNLDFTKKREFFIGLNAGLFGYQDSRFFKTTFRGGIGGVELGSRLIKPNSIRGYSFKFQGGLGHSKDTDAAATTWNLGAVRYEYLQRVRDNWYVGGQLDLLDIHFASVSDLPNTTSLTVNNSLMAKLAYRRTTNRGWTFHSGFAIGLVSLNRNSQTATVGFPEKAVKDGDVDLFRQAKDVVTTKHFSVVPIGKLNKISWRNEIYKKRWVFSYTWEMLNSHEAGKPTTLFSHALGIRYNIINKTR